MTTSQRLRRTTPEAAGIPSAAILAFLEAAEREIHDLHSVMLLRHGGVVAEGWWAPYRPESPHMLFSLSKSFTSTALGLAVAEGRLSVDDPVLSFFPAEAPATVSPNLAAMRVRHLLTMTTGHVQDTVAPLREEPDGNWARAFLAWPVEREPGTHFVYNSGATYMLSAIVQGLTGQTVLDYLQPRLFAPLGITGATWETCPRGINVGGWGLNVTSEDIACFGELYRQGGRWHGAHLVPAAWVAEASRRQVPNDGNANPDWRQGYGYQFWRARHGAYRGDGAFGQFCVVMPDQAAVLVTTAGVGEMQPILDLVWDHLLPAMTAAALPEDGATQASLRQRLADLTLAPPAGRATSSTAARVSGQTYALAANERGLAAVTVAFNDDGATLTLRDERGEHRIACGHGHWRPGTTTLDPIQSRRLPMPPTRAVAASGAWTAADTYQAALWYTETPFRLTLTCQFADDRLTLDGAVNVSFGPTAWPRLEGRSVVAADRRAGNRS